MLKMIVIAALGIVLLIPLMLIYSVIRAPLDLMDDLSKTAEDLPIWLEMLNILAVPYGIFLLGPIR